MVFSPAERRRSTFPMRTLLVHGLGRTPVSLFGVSAALRHARHRTRFFGYSPTFESVPRISNRLVNLLRALAQRKEPVGLVGHSLGGLLLRRALAEVPELRVHHLVFLGTPQAVPRAARLAWRWFPPFRILARGCAQLLTSADTFASLPALKVPFTIIAGTAGPRGRFSPFHDEPNDGLVAVSETRITEAEPILLPVLHTIMMDAPAVREHIVRLMRL